MADLFDNVLVCKDCGTRMAKGHVMKNGIAIRAASCSRCGKKEYHPLDLSHYREFQEIRSKPFHVKLRLVGNSYAVSIPREILEFMQEAQERHKRMRQAMEQEVEMMLEEVGKLAVFFNKPHVSHSHASSTSTASAHASHASAHASTPNPKQNNLNKKFLVRIR